MIHADPMTSLGTGNGAVLCHSARLSEQERLQFLLRNNIIHLKGCFSSDKLLYDSIDFPFQKVEEILQSTERLDYLYILINSPMEANFRVYDEYVFKNYPFTTKLLKKIRGGGDTFVFNKPNRDVLFVKFHNIYEDEPLLHIAIR